MPEQVMESYEMRIYNIENLGLVCNIVIITPELEHKAKSLMLNITLYSTLDFINHLWPVDVRLWSFLWTWTLHFCKDIWNSFFWGGCLYIYLSYGFSHVCTSSFQLGQRRSPPTSNEVQKMLGSYYQVKPFIHLASLMVWCDIGGKSLFCHYLGWDTAHIAVLRLV